MEEFKDRLQKAMDAKGINAADLHRLTGIGEGAISQYRRGVYKATQKNLEKIASALGVSIPYLMGLTDGPAISQDEDILQAIHDKPGLRMMFDVNAHATNEDIKQAVEIVKAFYRTKGQGGDAD